MARGCIRRRAGVVGLLAGTGLLLPAHGEPLPWRAADARPSYNLYGVTGLIDMPSAESQPDGQIAFTTSWMGGELRNTLNFQILPRIDGSFRYSILNDYFDSGSSLYDRSFDIKIRLFDEGALMPAVALGFQDFLGTGVYSGEYLVATKHITPELKITGGVGWGRFANANTVENPVGIIWEGAKDRDSSEGQIGQTGNVRFGQFFRGEDMGFFGGLEWQTPIDGLSVKAELSSDDYSRDWQFSSHEVNAPINIGVEYRPWEGVELGAYAMYGSTFGLRATFTGNPIQPLAPPDARNGPLPIAPRAMPASPTAAARFGPVRELIDARPAGAGPSPDAVELEQISSGPRWAYVTLPEAQARTGVCPTDSARRVDADLGVVDGVTFRSPSGAPVCTVVLRPAGREWIAAERRLLSGWDTSWHDDDARVAGAVARVVEALDAEKLIVEALSLDATQISIELANSYYAANAQAIGRAAAALTRTLPPSVERFNITLIEGGEPAVTVALRRALLEQQAGEPDAARRSWLTADIGDASGPRPETLPGFYPDFVWGLNPHVPLGLFDPDSPLRADLQVRLFGALTVARGVSFNGQLSQRLIGNLGESDRVSDSVLPHVRSDSYLYAQSDVPTIDRLSADYVFKLAPDTYGRLSGGLLESMFAGVSAEVLWKPVDQSWGLGAELNWVVQRDYDQYFEMLDYTVVTGHASLYWDTGFYGMQAQVDAGRYLAGDWGATFSLTRTFANGWEVGGFFTLTDVPFDEYGEGSFDKGLRLTIPLGWAAPYESRSRYTMVLRPLTRDGGQRLEVANRLYGVVADSDRAALREDWSSFWK
jgi:hypothetical protein